MCTVCQRHVIQPQAVTDFVHQYRQQIHLSRRHRISRTQFGAGNRHAKLGIVVRRRIDIPTVAGGIGINKDRLVGFTAQVGLGQIDDGEGNTVQRGLLIRCQAGLLPACHRGRRRGIQIGRRQYGRRRIAGGTLLSLQRTEELDPHGVRNDKAVRPEGIQSHRNAAPG